jgi:hypothetical protein
MSYVVEITILPVNCSDPRIRALMPNSNIPTSPVFQCEDGQVYFRKHSTIIKVIRKMSSITEKNKFLEEFIMPSHVSNCTSMVILSGTII